MNKRTRDKLYNQSNLLLCIGITIDFVIVTQSGSFSFKYLLQSHFSVDGDSVIFKHDKWNYSWQWSYDTISSPAVPADWVSGTVKSGSVIKHMRL